MSDTLLSPNQTEFVRDARDQGLRVDYHYSGRGMYGERCPAVRVACPNDIATKAVVEIDNMGRGFVVYARS